MGLSRILALAVLLAATWSVSAFAAGKYALVVGNSDYQRAGKLPNASSDAELIAAKLASVGFEVDKLIDAGEDALGEALDKMARKVDGADAVALYFAGHGLQKDGVTISSLSMPSWKQKPPLNARRSACKVSST